MHSLMEADLIDEYHFLVQPIIVGFFKTGCTRRDSPSAPKH